MFETNAHEDWQQQLEEEKLREELDHCHLLHKNGLDKAAVFFAKRLGIDSHFQHELRTHRIAA